MVEFAANLGWGELKNGVLLATAELHKFDVMITADQNIKYQQNLTRRKIALVVLGSNRWITELSAAHAAVFPAFGGAVQELVNAASQ